MCQYISSYQKGYHKSIFASRYFDKEATMKTKLNRILLITAVMFLLVANAYADITRGPYLQPTEDMGTSVGVAWRTANGGTSTIYYGINDVSENSASVEPQEATEGTTTVYKYYIKLEVSHQAQSTNTR
jgi:hypothetical protein